MSKNIHITDSTMQGTFAIGDKSRAVTSAPQSFSGNLSVAPLDVLSRELERHGVTNEQFHDLRDALLADETTFEVKEKKFGPAVKSWIKSMMGKAIDSTWQIELGVAGSLLASALQNYYGWFQER